MKGLRPGVAMLAGVPLLILAYATPLPRAVAEPGGRYAMQPIEGGVLRLDTETGAMALCTRKGAGIVCEAVETPQNVDKEVARVEAENRQLKAEIRRLEDLVAMDAQPGQTKRGSRFELPSEEDIDKALGTMERIMKKFRDKLKEFEGGPKRGEPL